MYCNQIPLKFKEICVTLPDSHIVVEKEVLEKLQSKAEEGHYLSLKDVLSMLSVSRPWLLENVLYRSNIRNEIDIERNVNGFVKYPNNQGGRYYFLASKTRQYFETHFKEIFKEL